MNLKLVALISLLFLLPISINCIAKFDVSTVSDSSVVIRMIDATNVTYFDITVHIFDLATQKLYRTTQLEHVTNDQLLSFDGLKSNNWFAIRIVYRLNFIESVEDNSLRTTKQEIVVKTKKTARDDPKKIEQLVAFIDDLFVSKDNIYIGVGTVFKQIKKISTVIVPELRCTKGVLSPVSQQVVQHASFHFDLSKFPKQDRNCNTICVFPYLRFTNEQSTIETFRAKEWCGSIEETKHLLTSSSINNLNLLLLLLLVTLL